MSMQVKVFWLALFAWLLPSTTDAQVAEPLLRNAFFIEPKLGIGHILDIYPSLPEHSTTFAGEINFAWQTIGKQYWNQYYKFPQVGVLLGITDLGNPAVLGQEFSLVPNLSYRLSHFGKFNLFGVFGLGFAYFNRPYDRTTNPENKFIGTRITNKTILGLNLDYAVSNHFSISGGVSYSHYSNGHYQLPNVGINIPAVELGLKYFTRGYPDQFHVRDSLIPVGRKWMLNLRLGFGIHEFGDPVKPVGGPKYPIYNGSVYVSKRLGPVVNFHTGLHLNYYTSIYDYLLFQKEAGNKNPAQAMTALGFAGIEVLMGHFSFTTQLGVYFYNPVYRQIQKSHNYEDSFKHNMKQYVSLKIGGQFYLFNTRIRTRLNPWIGIFIKTNAGQADFAEVSIGFAF